MNPRDFFAELQRRHVYKVGAAYVVAGWLLVQIVTQVFPIFNVCALAQRVIVLAIVAGFIATLILTWLYDITSHVVVRTGNSIRMRSMGLSRSPSFTRLRKEPDPMFDWLDRAYTERDSGLTQLLIAPFFSDYQTDPRFAALCQKLKVQVPPPAGTAPP